MTEKRYNPTLHTLALLTAVATFPLIFMGGLVTSHGAGMSVPDWPNSYGYNMFLFPPSKWVGGIFYEHTHRLMGTLVGFLSILLAWAAWKWESRGWARQVCYAVLGAVIIQGVLGGLWVVLVKLDLAIIHACFAQAFFCLTAMSAVVTSKWWMSQSTANVPNLSGSRLVWLAIVCVLAIYAQLVIAAVMRHYEAGLAITDLPFAYGKLIPPTDQSGLDAINHIRAWEMNLPRVSLSQVWLHFGHRVGAVIVSALVVALSINTLITREDWALRGPALLLPLLLIGQITLGVFTVLMRKPADIASLHVACGALLLATAFVLMVRARKVYEICN